MGVLEGTPGTNIQASITADASSSCSAVWPLEKTFCSPLTVGWSLPLGQSWGEDIKAASHRVKITLARWCHFEEWFFFFQLPSFPHQAQLHPNFPTSVLQHLLCHSELLLIRATGLLKGKCWRRNSCYLSRKEWSYLWRRYPRLRFAFPKVLLFKRAKKIQTIS